MKALERTRAFACRRLNLRMKTIVAGADAADPAKAADARLVATLVEAGWTTGALAGLDDEGRECGGRLHPAAEALGGSEEAAVPAAWEAFEAWLAQSRAVFDRYVPDTPEVDF